MFTAQGPYKCCILGGSPRYRGGTVVSAICTGPAIVDTIGGVSAATVRSSNRDLR